MDSTIGYNFQGKCLSRVSHKPKPEVQLIPLVGVGEYHDTSCIGNSLAQLYKAFFDTTAPLSSLIEYCDSTWKVVYGYKRIVKTSLNGITRHEEWLGLTPNSLQPAWKYVHDSASGIRSITSYAYDDLTMKDSAILVLEDGLLSGGRYWNIGTTENPLLANISQYQPFVKWPAIERTDKTVYTKNDLQMLLQLSTSLDTLFRNIAKKHSSFSASNCFNDHLAALTGSYRRHYIGHYHQNLAEAVEHIYYAKGKRVQEVRGAVDRVYYPNQKLYLELIAADTCKNCDSIQQPYYHYKPKKRKIKQAYRDFELLPEYIMKDVYYFSYKLYYPNGNLMGVTKPIKNLTNYALNYTCEDSSKFFTFPFDFDSFYDSTGNQVFDGEEGKITLLGSHGKPVYERVYKNGVIEGLVKGYSLSGKLNSTGYYVDGKKQGVWFNGSLDGEFDWGLICRQNLGDATNSVQQNPFVHLNVQEYDKGVLLYSQTITYKKK